MNEKLVISAPLPVFRTIAAAFQFVWNTRGRFLRALIIPATAICILNLTTPQTHSISSDPSFSGRALYGLLSFLIQTALYGLFAITCHRLALIGEHSVPDYGLHIWTMRESRYLGWFFVVLVVWMLFSFVVNGFYVTAIIGDVEAGASVESFESTRRLLNLLYIPLMYMLCRLSVLYPAIAVDQPVTAQGAWRLTAGNGWRMTAVVVGLPWIIFFLVNLLVREQATFVESLLFRLIGLSLLAVEIVALSFSYKHLTATGD